LLIIDDDDDKDGVIGSGELLNKSLSGGRSVEY